MKITYQWIKNYIECDQTPKELVETLTDLGLEVESVISTLSSFEGVVVGRVLTVGQHPDAEKLSLCQVDTGAPEPLNIVCGAPNVAANTLVPVAAPGATLPFGKVTSRKIRGVQSFGMICSEEELGFAESSEGIWILEDEKFKVGSSFRDYFQEDVVFELAIGPNRPDCLGVRGVLRELAQVTGSNSTLPEPPPPSKEQSEYSITIEDTEGCPRYVGALVRGIKVGESPGWLREKLHLLGLRSINNIVDLTNYLMMEYGHPMHAFDADLLRGSEIRIRSAEPGEELVTLDGVTRKLSDEDLLICDSEGPVALAGVMGGENSEIRDQTTNLFLEIAYFDPIRIRRSSRKLKLHTDASHRFERGMDPELPLVLTGITIQHILDLAGGEFMGILDAYPNPWKAKKIVFDPALIKRILGIELTVGRMEEILVKLGCEVQMNSMAPWGVFPPSFRPDLERPIDLVEEICRIHGMNEVPFEAPKISLEFHRDRHIKTCTEKLQDLLVGAGLQECVTYSFSDQDPPDSVKILNPISDKMGQLRSTISEKLLDSALYNYKQQNEKIGLFEVGTTFSRPSQVEGDKPYREETHLSVLLCNQQEVNWKNQSLQSDVFDLKGILDKITVLFGSKFRLRAASELPPFLDRQNSLDILFRNQRAGFMGVVDPSLLAKEKIHDAMVVLELCLDEVFLAGRKEPVFKQLPQMPGARKQLALITPSTLPCEDVLKAIGSLKIPTLESFEVFDLYTGKGISEGHKSLGINFMFRGREKTLSEEEMTSSVDKILEALHKKYSIVLRP